MTRITGDDFMLAGLHQMAATRGEGLTPELLDLLRTSRGGSGAQNGVLPFPPGGGTVRTTAVVEIPREDNVIAFPTPARRAGRR